MSELLAYVNKLSFPGLGIDEFTVDEVAFSIFGRDVAWYGIIVTMAIIAICAYVYIRGQRIGISADDLLDYFIYSIIFGVIGARLYYVLFYGISKYIVHDGGFFHNLSQSFINIIAVWNGGLAIYGGIIAVFLTVYVVSKIKKIDYRCIIDLAGHAVLLSQAIGRWGNFVNAEAHGGETDIFCRMGITNSLGYTAYYHPTFLYESLWNLIGFIIVGLHLKRQKYEGQVFIWYITWYGFGRMFIEGLRTDSLYIGDTGIRVSQLLAFCLFAAGAVMLTIFGRKYRGRTHEEFLEERKTAVSAKYASLETLAEAETSEEEIQNDNNDDNKGDESVGNNT